MIAFTDDHNNFDGHTYVTRQIAGPSLFADAGKLPKVGLHPGKPAAGPEVIDSEGDTETSPSTHVPAPAFDILAIDYEIEKTPDGKRQLVVTMTVADLPVLPGSSYRAYFSVGGEVPDKGTRYFVEATNDVDVAGGAPAFLYGTAGRLNNGAISDTRRGDADGGAFNVGTPGTIVMRIGFEKIGNPPRGTVIHGTMGRARATVENSRLVLDRTRGGRALTVK